MPAMTKEDMEKYLDEYGMAWGNNADEETLNTIVKRFVSDARIHQVARFAVLLMVRIRGEASADFCDRLEKFL